MMIQRCLLVLLIALSLSLMTALRSLPVSNPTSAPSVPSSSAAPSVTSSSPPSSSQIIFVRSVDALPTSWAPLYNSDGTYVNAPASAEMSIVIAFAHRNVDYLTALFNAVSDPTHSSYRQFVSKADVISMIAPLPSALAAVQQWLTSGGVASADIVSAGDAYSVTAAVSVLETLFSCQMLMFEHTSGETLPSCVGAISVPASIGAVISNIIGLYTFPFEGTGNGLEYTTTNQTGIVSGRRRLMQTNGFVVVTPPQTLISKYGLPSRTGPKPSSYSVNVSASVVEFDVTTFAPVTYNNFNRSDLSEYRSFIGYASNFTVPPSSVQGNGTNDESLASIKASIDIDSLFAINPYANNGEFKNAIGDYLLTFTIDFLNLPPAHRPQVVSISYGLAAEQGNCGFDSPNQNYPITSTPYCDSSQNVYGINATTYETYTNNQFMLMGLAGVSVIVGTGDYGAWGLPAQFDSNGNTLCSDGTANLEYDSQGNYFFNNDLQVFWPASSPYVTAVGATDIGQNASLQISSVVGSPAPICGYTGTQQLVPGQQWACVIAGQEAPTQQSSPLSGYNSGGGFSTQYPMPAYQQYAVGNYTAQANPANGGLAFPNYLLYTPTNRAIPDVSIYGGNWAFVVDGLVNARASTYVAAPIFAGFVTLLNEVATAISGKSLGFLNPLLYQMAQNDPTTFNDFGQGYNNICPQSATGNSSAACTASCQGYQSAVGWDAVSGLGSPNFPRMSNYLLSHPQFVTTQLQTYQFTMVFSTPSQYIITYSGTWTLPLIPQTVGGSTAYQVLTANGTRNYTDLLHGVVQLTQIVGVAPVGTLNNNDNLFYPQRSAVLDSAGVVFALNIPPMVNGVTTTSSNILVSYDGYQETGLTSTGNTTYIPSNTAVVTTLITSAAGTPTSIQGDPQFTGFNAQSYQVHGIPATVYNIISTASLQFNAEFIFLDNGVCSDELAARTSCWGHPGTYLGSIGIRVRAGDREVIITIHSGAKDEGMIVAIDGKIFEPTDSVVGLPSSNNAVVNVTMDCAFVVRLETAEYDIRIDNSDHFLNQQTAMRPKLISHLKAHNKAMKAAGMKKRFIVAGNNSTLPHGLLGQTWSTAKYDNQWKYIEGDVNEYSVADGLLGTQFIHNRYEL